MDTINNEMLEFIFFCIENVATRLNCDGLSIYLALTEKSDILYNYILPCYIPLHTQSKDYIVDDILKVMKERNVSL